VYGDGHKEPFMKLMLALFVLSLSSSVFAGESEDIIATTIIMEAGGEGFQGMKAVMCVIKNRSKGSDSVEDWKKVVLKRKQFSCFNNVSISSAIVLAKRHSKFNEALSLVEWAKQDADDITKGSTHYHVHQGKSRVTPYWTSPELGGKNKKAVIQGYIGNHVFLSSVD